MATGFSLRAIVASRAVDPDTNHVFLGELGTALAPTCLRVARRTVFPQVSYLLFSFRKISLTLLWADTAGNERFSRRHSFLARRVATNVHNLYDPLTADFLDSGPNAPSA